MRFVFPVVAAIYCAIGSSSAADLAPWVAGESRSQQAQARSFLYAVPRGFEQGRCDRELALAAGQGGAFAGIVSPQLAGPAPGPARANPPDGGIGGAMDAADLDCVARVLEYSPDRAPISWSNPGGIQFQVIPIRTWVDRDGRTCRNLHVETVRTGRAIREVAAACRIAAGGWSVTD